jgi:membrane associated rhomboid family serine protease
VATCYRHPNRETGVACSNCGRPICPDCMTPTPVGMRCPECARQRTKVVRARSMSGVAMPVTYALIAINVIVFLIEIGTGAGAVSGGLVNSSVVEHGALSRATVADGDYWRLVSSGFLHAGFLHIIFNMYILYMLGQMLESAVGSFRFAVIYFVSLLCGSFGALLFTKIGLTVGASGAVFGLASAGVMVMRSRGIDPMQSGLPLFIGINLLLGFVISGISIGGHIGGLVGGALAAVALFDIGERRRGVVPQFVPLLICVAIAVAAVIGSLVVANSGG